MVKVVTRIVELTSPAASRKMVQVTRSVAKPMLRQHSNIPERPIRVTGRRPMRSERHPQKMPVVPPKAYAQSKIPRRYDVERFPQ